MRRDRCLLPLLAAVLSSCGGGVDPVNPPPPPAVASVTLNQSALSLTPPQTATLVATVKDAAGNPLTGRTISWSTSAGAVAAVDATGVVTAVSPGTAQVTASSEGKSASATITVAAVAAPVASVTLNQTAAALVTTQTVALVATPRDAGGNALGGRAINWGSNGATIASVDNNGVVTANALGSATITATSEGQSATAAITVGPGAFLGPSGGSTSAFSGNVSLTFPASALSTGTAVTIALVASPPPDPMLVTGSAYDFGPTGTTFAQPVTLKLKYAAGSIPAGGVEGSLRLYLRNGSAWEIVPGSTVDVATKTVTGSITHFSVYAILDRPLVQSVVVAPATDNIASGSTRQFSATVTADPGAAQTVTWRSAVSSVATISASGLATAVGIGTTTITAVSTADTTRKGTAQLTVSATVFPINWTETSDGVIGPLATTTFNTLTVRGDGSLIGVGAGGVISLRSITGTWSATQSPVATTLNAVSAPSPDSVWVSGASGVILKRVVNGTWTAENSGSTRQLDELSVNSNGSGYAAEQGTANLYRRQAGAWSAVAGAPAMYGISASGSVLYGLTTSLNVTRFDGATWTTLTAPSGMTFGSVFALNGTDALAGNANSSFQAAIWRVSGSTWAQEWVGTAATSANGISQFARCTDGSVMAVTATGLVLARNGTTWSARPEGQTGITGYGSATRFLACNSATDWYFTSGLKSVAHATGGAVTYELMRASLSKLSIGSAGFAFAGGNGDPVVLRWTGTTWIPVPIPFETVISSGGPGLAAWSGTGAMTLAGGSSQGTWNGAGWTWTPRQNAASAMWASGPNDIWSVGRFVSTLFGPATIQHFTGAWSAASALSLSANFVNVHGAGPAVFAAGFTSTFPAQGVIARPNAAATDFVATPLKDVVAFSATSAIAVGSAGSAYRWNGAAWSAIPVSTTENLLAVTGRSESEVYAFGDQGSLFGWNGTQWVLIKHLSKVVRAARMLGDFGIAVGDDGIIVYGRLNAGLRR